MIEAIKACVRCEKQGAQGAPRNVIEKNRTVSSTKMSVIGRGRKVVVDRKTLELQNVAIKKGKSSQHSPVVSVDDSEASAVAEAWTEA